MASGKKGKKTKGKTLALTDFLQETTGSIPSQPIRKSATNWADEVDDYDAVESKIVNVVLPTAPKASRDFDDIANKVPKDPPFIAYLSNLPYDVDEDEIAEFFKNLKIANMRIPKDERAGEAPKLKGFGYVEFEDRDSLMSALIIPDTNLKNRRIRIEVAANAENDRRRGRMGDRMGGADTGGDWRSTNRPEPIEDRRGGGFNRDRDRDRDSGGGFTREGMREGGRDRDYGGFNRDRDFGRERDFNRDRDGGFSRNRDQDDRPGAWRDGDRPSNFNDRGYSRSNHRESDINSRYHRDERDDRSNFNDRGYSRGNYRDSDRNSRYDRDERDDRRSGFRRFDDNERNGGLTRSSNRGDKDDRDSEAPSSETRQRPKLNLAPRTKPLEQPSVKSEPAVPSASIFGNAKPVDTTERERQIEEKLLKEQEERLTESSKDRDRNDGEEGADKRNLERGRPPARTEDKDTNKDQEGNNRDRGPPSRERRNASGDDNRRSGQVRSEHRSPDQKKKVEKQEKPKREEKKDRAEKELPKLQEPEVPNFQGSNKYALLDDSDD